MQAASEVQETPARSVTPDRVPGLDSASTCHFDPRICSTSAWLSLPLVVHEPTATQKPTEGHDTPVIPASTVRGGVGRTPSVHRAPFHRAANGMVCPPRMNPPVAMHAVVDMQEMLLS